MSFRRLLFVLTISVIVIITGLFGFSYAWYYYGNAATSFNVATSNVINPSVDVVYAQSDTINIFTGIPISSDKVADRASHTDFTVYANSTSLSGYNVKTEIALSNITIDAALKTSMFKYQLVENVAGSENVISTGTGLDFGINTTKVLKTMALINKGTTYSYTIRIWLQDDDTDQNSLMGKAFSAKVKITSMITK